MVIKKEAIHEAKNKFRIETHYVVIDKCMRELKNGISINDYLLIYYQHFVFITKLSSPKYILQISNS